MSFRHMPPPSDRFTFVCPQGNFTLSNTDLHTVGERLTRWFLLNPASISTRAKLFACLLRHKLLGEIQTILELSVACINP
jgi:hypothetical protein